MGKSFRGPEFSSSRSAEKPREPTALGRVGAATCAIARHSSGVGGNCNVVDDERLQGATLAGGDASRVSTNLLIGYDRAEGIAVSSRLQTMDTSFRRAAHDRCSGASRGEYHHRECDRAGTNLDLDGRERRFGAASIQSSRGLHSVVGLARGIEPVQPGIDGHHRRVPADHQRRHGDEPRVST